jgi:phage terminase large subunit-like protein
MATELHRFRRFAEGWLDLRVEPFQVQIVREVFSERRETLVLLPRGNGKSTLLAAIGLWHLLSAKQPQVAVGAASREQAAVLFDIARGMASHPAIASRVEITRREIRTPAGWLKVVASDGPKQHGLILSLAIVDELHAHRDAELYTALRTGMLKRKDARMVTISTAASDEETALGEVRERALRQPQVAQKRVFTRAVGPHLALLEWALPDDADIDDMQVVKEANPASWLSEADLAEQREAVHELAFRRYHCNQWVASTESAIAPAEWAGCASEDCEIPQGADDVHIGVDLGLKWDSTAFVPIWRTEDGKVRVHAPAILVPPRDGTSLDFEEVFATAEVMRERWPSCVFVLDPEAGGELLAQRIDAELGGVVMTHSQKATPMCKASQLLAETIATGGLEHPNDAQLNRHVLSAAARFYGVGWRFVKQKARPLPIDACVALAMALRVLVAETQTATTTDFIPAGGSGVFLG